VALAIEIQSVQKCEEFFFAATTTGWNSILKPGQYHSAGALWRPGERHLLVADLSLALSLSQLVFRADDF